MRFPRALSGALTFLVMVAAPQAALAYIGPGAGITAIGTAIALVGGILLAIVGFIWYPIKRLLRSRKKDADADTSPVE